MANIGDQRPRGIRKPALIQPMQIGIIIEHEIPPRRDKALIDLISLEGVS
jgi:hypothetical protein